MTCGKVFSPLGDEDEEDNRSNLHIPRTYQIVDTIRARMLMALFKNKPYIEFTPAPSYQTRYSTQKSEDKAEVASSLVNEQLRKNNISAKFYDYLTSLLTFPKGILGVGWRYEEDYIKKKVQVPEIVQTPNGFQYTGDYVSQVQESRETIWDDNEIVNIDYFDFWPDPKGSNLDDCRGVFQREFVTKEELLQRLNFLDELNEGQIYLQSVKELEEITAISSSKIVADERIEASDLSIISKNRSKVNMNVDANNVDINASGESNLKLELNCDMVFIKINTNSEINLSGSIKKAHLKAGSSAIISAKNLEIDEADITATGKADVSVNVTGNMKLYSSSGAIIKYSGKSEVVSEKTESGGKIKQF